MGQAFRRATGRIASSGADTTTSSSSQLKKAVDQRPPAVPVNKVTAHNIGPPSEGGSRTNADNVLEERDRQYDDMLNQMAGRIRSKAGGKLEMGEALVVEKYKRPLPKLRNTTIESGRYEDRSAPPGTLNVVQIRHIILLHQGKADDHIGPMNVQQIAEKFRVDVPEVERILQYISLPPEDTSEQKNDR